MSNQNKEIKHSILIIPVTEFLKKPTIAQLAELQIMPMYQILPDGSLKPNMGRKKDPYDVLVYDVTDASEELKSFYSDLIKEYDEQYEKERRQKAVRFLSLLPEHAVSKTNKELESLPLYTLVTEGVLKINSGVRRNQNESIFYDVTNASDDLKSTFAKSIIEYPIKKIIGEKARYETGNLETSENSSISPLKIKTVLSLLNGYTELSLEERNQIGYRFVVLDSLDDGIQMVPIRLRGPQPISGNTYIDISDSILSEELYEKLSDSMTELVQKENGLYEQKNVLAQSKEL